LASYVLKNGDTILLFGSDVFLSKDHRMEQEIKVLWFICYDGVAAIFFTNLAIAHIEPKTQNVDEECARPRR
jgi:hypothetical protein